MFLPQKKKQKNYVIYYKGTLNNQTVTVADMEVSSPVAKSTLVTEVYVIEPVHVFNTAPAETTAEPQI